MIKNISFSEFDISFFNRKIIMVIEMKMEYLEKEKRPREKIINEGPFNLSDAELLAIMLASGTKSESIIDLSNRLIKEYGLKNLFDMPYEELIKISGIKMAKATKLLATFEIARRCNEKKNIDIILNDSNDVFNYIKDEYILLKQEVLTVIYVKSNLSVISKEKYSSNEISKTELPIKKIIYNVITKKATGIFLVHNHPGGNIKPSNSDKMAVLDLINALKPLGCHVFDSIIISNDKYYSMEDEISNNVLNRFKK